MAISFSRPDPSSPSAIAAATFNNTRKGFDQAEVREFLRMVAAELARLQERERFLERELRTSQRSPISNAPLDEELVTKMLGEETARILSTAREAASQIKVRAEEGAARLLREATEESQRLREDAEIESSRRRTDASADAEAELEMAKQQGREMVNEARDYRERVLSDLARRRETARQQIEQMVHGRDRLVQAFERSRLAAVDVIGELTPLVEPGEYVDLSPTTGPVPVTVANMPRPAALRSVPELAPEVEVVEEVAEVVDEVADVEVVEIAVVEIVELIVEEDEPFEVVHQPSADATVVPLFGDRQDHLIEDEHDVDIELIEDELTEAEQVDDELVEDQLADDELVDESAVDHQLVDDELVDDELVDELVEPEATDSDGQSGEQRASVDDLFARLRASRTQGVADRASQAASAEVSPEPEPQPVVEPELEAELEPEPVVIAAPVLTLVPKIVADSVFATTPDAPVDVVVVDDTPFAHRDESLTPLIVAAARKLKRVLADEQNDVLHVLRGKAPTRTVEALVSTEADQVGRYAMAIAGELTAAAVAGAMSMGASAGDAQRDVKRFDSVASATALLSSDVIRPLRDRLARCVNDADGDNDELASLIRLVYREWKNQRIDEQLDDIARTAFGRGALAGVVAGAPICWSVDPNGPGCPDAEDNALQGTVCAGQPFPTDHLCAPAHSGCRCMIRPVTS